MRALALLGALAAAPLAAQPLVLSPETPASGAAFGSAVAAINDLDGDGVRDLLVSAPGEPNGKDEPAGRVYAISGATGTRLFVIASPEAGARFGADLDPAGDANGDGVPDFLVGAPYGSAGGEVFVFSGEDQTPLLRLSSPNGEPSFGIAVARVEDSDADGTEDVLVGTEGRGTDTPGVAYVFSGDDGSELAAAGSPDGPAVGFAAAVDNLDDLDGDGAPEALVGAPLVTVGEAAETGRAYAYSVSGTAARVVTYANPADASGARFGRAVSRIGDLDGDAVADVIVGAVARVYVLSGASGELLFTLASPSPDASGSFGSAVSGAADLDDDGTPDVLVGAPQEARVDGEDGASGAAYVFSGADGSLIRTIPNPAPEASAGFGTSVALAGTVDDDELPDYLIGAPGGESGGRAFLIGSAPPVASEPGASSPLALRAWPNPSRGEVRVELPRGVGGTVVVADALGREVARATPEASGAARIDTRGWTPGVYVLRWTSGERDETVRLTVM